MSDYKDELPRPPSPFYETPHQSQLIYGGCCASPLFYSPLSFGEAESEEDYELRKLIAKAWYKK